MCDLLTGKFMEDLRAERAASDPLRTVGVSRTPSPMASPGGTGTTRKTWRDLLFTMLVIDALWLTLFALCWLLAR